MHDDVTVAGGSAESAHVSFARQVNSSSGINSSRNFDAALSCFTNSSAVAFSACVENHFARSTAFSAGLRADEIHERGALGVPNLSCAFALRAVFRLRTGLRAVASTDFARLHSRVTKYFLSAGGRLFKGHFQLNDDIVKQHLTV